MRKMLSTTYSVHPACNLQNIESCSSHLQTKKLSKKRFRYWRRKKTTIGVFEKMLSLLETCYPINNVWKLPRAIATVDGKPIKGSKANTTKCYQRRYSKANLPLISTSLPNGWTDTRQCIPRGDVSRLCVITLTFFWSNILCVTSETLLL